MILIAAVRNAQFPVGICLGKNGIRHFTEEVLLCVVSRHNEAECGSVAELCVLLFLDLLLCYPVAQEPFVIVDIAQSLVLKGSSDCFHQTVGSGIGIELPHILKIDIADNGFRSGENISSPGRFNVKGFNAFLLNAAAVFNLKPVALILLEGEINGESAEQFLFFNQAVSQQIMFCAQTQR